MNTKKLMAAFTVLLLTGAMWMQAAEYVTIGGSGNPADSGTGYGAVSYTYKISKTEISVAEFLASGAGNGNEPYWNDGVRTLGSNAPAAFVCWYEAAQFCNWLTSGDITSGAYQLDSNGFVTNMMTRAQILAAGGLFYVLPTEDEWYKAAYYTGSGYSLYANGTAAAPGTSDARYGGTEPWPAGSGMIEQNGTFDMMGNLWEWTESAWDGTLNDFSENIVLRGGGYDSGSSVMISSARYWEDPLVAAANVGFRVAVVPEPATTALLGVGSAGLFGFRRFRKKGLDGLFDFSGTWMPLIFLPARPAAVITEGTPRDAGKMFWGWYDRFVKNLVRLPQTAVDVLLSFLIPDVFVRTICPDCGTVNIRRSRREPGTWERLFRLKPYVCNDCGRRFISGA